MKITGFGRESKTSLDNQKGITAKNMSALQAGDKFKATILDIKRNEITIRLSDGNVITAKSLIIPETRIGDTMEFTVQDNKDGQILLSMFSDEQGNQQQTNTLLNVLFSANIMPSEEALAVVKALMDNNLPVDKATLQNILQMFKSNPNLDMETLAFMLKENIAVTAKNIEQVKLTVQNENQIKNQIDELAFKIAGIDEPQIKEQVLAIFLPELAETKNISVNLETQEQREAFKEITNLIVDNKEILSDVIDIIKNGGDTKEVLEMLQNKYPEKSELFNIIKNDENLNYVLKELLDELINSKHSTKEMKPEALAKSIKESLFIDIKDNTPDEVNKYYQQLYDKVTKALTLTEIGTTENTRDATKALADIRDNIEFMNNINKFQEFIQIPFKLGDTNNQGDLYIFSDKKGKKISKDRASVLLSLDLSMLGHFEAFIQKDFKNISCQFRTMDKKIQGLLQLNMPKLQTALKQKGYNLTQIIYKTIEEPFNILQSSEEAGFETQEQLQQTNKRYSFDMRA